MLQLSNKVGEYIAPVLIEHLYQSSNVVDKDRDVLHVKQM